jgi:class 3 adenylate cyclase/tetratricopeptide (TPR) repeat protein
MQCPLCQQHAPSDAKYCPQCGAKLIVICAQCGAANVPTNRFCTKCGQPFTTVPPPPDQRFASPEAYTPQHLAARIVTSRSALEGERKQVTVLFADVKGSMELLIDRDPEEARRILDPVLEGMMEAVHRYEGTVNQVMGDGIMALFGAPIAHEDHAVRACYAALRMQDAIRRYTEEIRRSHGVEVQIRVGLNSGGVVVRSIGSDLRMDYTAVGQTTHLAARMEQLATPGTIRLTDHTLRLVEGFVQVRPLGPVAVRGLAEPIEVFELTGAAASHTRLQVAATRGLTRFVGRDAEMSALYQALTRAGSGRGQVVAVIAEPGVGKSRLVWELTHSERVQDWLVLESDATSYGKATPYLPVIDLFRAYFQIQDADDASKIREKASGKLMGLDQALMADLVALLGLLDVPIDDPHWQAVDPLLRRRRTLDGCKHLVFRESRVQPLLLVVEDLQWIDGETQAFLDDLVESLAGAPIVLLVSYRPEYHHGWGSKTYYTQLRLDVLPPESADELLSALLGSDTQLDALKRILIERTQGNPFFLEESVRTLIETGVLLGERGAYRLTRDVTTVQVAPTVHAVLAARIDRLPSAEKALLQSASVVGKDVPVPILRAIAELPEQEFRQCLGNLQATEFLYETSLFSDLNYTFKHALTHEVAYGSLVQARRRALHSRIVEAIETFYADRLTEQLDQLAHHAVRGEIWSKALTYLVRAGAKAAVRSANREALTCFEQALVALQHLPSTPQLLEQALDLRFNLRNALLQLGEPGCIIDYLRQAEKLAEALSDNHRLGRVVASMAHYFWLMGDYNRALESGHRALAIGRALGDFPLEITTNYYLGLACHSLGQYRQGVEILRRNVASLTGEMLHERFGTTGFHSVFARGWLVWCLAELGEFAEAVARGEEGVQIAEAVDEPFSLIQAHLGVGGLYVRTGDFDRAISALERALALCQVAGIRVLVPRVATSLGYAYTISRRAAEALPLLERAVEQAFSMPVIFVQASALACLSEAYLMAGRPDDATESASRALGHARHHKERGNQAWILRLLAQIAAHRDPPDVAKAEDRYRHAIGLAEELEMRPLVAHCRLGLGRLCERTGRLSEAEQHLAAATVLFRDMNMRFWLGEAEAG